MHYEFRRKIADDIFFDLRRIIYVPEVMGNVHKTIIGDVKKYAKPIRHNRIRVDDTSNVVVKVRSYNTA